MFRFLDYLDDFGVRQKVCPYLFMIMLTPRIKHRHCFEYTRSCGAVASQDEGIVDNSNPWRRFPDHRGFYGLPETGFLIGTEGAFVNYLLPHRQLSRNSANTYHKRSGPLFGLS